MLLSREAGAPDPADLEPLGAFPLVIKPNDQGSTVGLSIINHASEIPAAFRAAAQHSRGILVETYIAGREMTVSMLGDRPLPVIEIIPREGLYDYRAKYTAGMSRYEVPAQIPAELAERMQEFGQRAFRLLGCDGVARVDFRLDPENRPYCLELNTVPGMTSTSLVPMAAKAIGMDYDELVAQMVKMAVDRRAAERGEASKTATS
jgi:D-alanine-D-alanine ligase